MGIGSSSLAWTPEPQCGVPVHILKTPRLPAPCWVLFVPLSLSLTTFLLLTVVLPLFLSLSFSWLLHHLTVFFSSMQQQADESGWADSPLPPFCLPSPLLSLCRPSQQTASPIREAQKSKSLSQPPPQLPPLECYWCLRVMQNQHVLCQKRGNVKSNMIQYAIRQTACIGIRCLIEC